MPRLSELTDTDYLPQPEAIPADIPRVYIDGNNDAVEQPSTFSSKIDKVLNSLFRDDEKRYQLWPEKVIREGLTGAGDVYSGKVPTLAIDPETGDVHTSPQMIEKAQAISALAGTGGLGGVTDATLGATPFLRPALKYKDRLYKGKEGQSHQDVIPDALYPEFQKMAMSGEDISHYNFGFHNDKGHFLNREDALKYGIDTGIIDPQAGRFGALTSTLMTDSSKPGTAIEAMGKTSYPLAKPSERFTNTLGQNDHLIQNMTPDEFLSKSRPLKIDAESRENINALKEHIKEGKPLDPVELHANGKEDGRHRAIAAKELGIKEIPVINFRPPEKADPFFSALEHNVAKINQSKMTGDQWLGTLSNKPGVKPEELDWTGLKSFLQENGKAPVTKSQIESHLAANKVELKEKVKSGSGSDPDNFDSPRYAPYQLPGGPLSRDTEILTDRGWKRIDAVKIGDVVMTRKDEAGILEWQPVQATPKVYAENLYHFYSQSINMRVTENHQMIAKKRRRSCGGLIRLTAKELWGISEMLVPLTGVWEGGETDKIFGFDPHDLAELFGWYLAEGSYKHKNGNKHTIQIAQCREYNLEKCERIEALLDRMGLPWRYYGDAYGIGTKTMNKDLAELFHEQPTSEFKFIPYFFFNQSKSVIQSLLDGLILGDGCVSEQDGRLNKTTFFTKSEQLAGDVQILILMIGKNANVRQRPSSLYCVGIKSKEWSSVDDAKFEIAPYDDFAFCVTVENHAIYVRRNGVAAFTGNSNYREMLLTLPDKTGEAAKFHNLELKVNSGTATLPERQMYYDMADNLKGNNKAYISSHWDEPNILAHVRMNDRTIEGKKSLHLEEIQSDWHQQGRDKGYASPKRQLTEVEQARLNDLSTSAGYRDLKPAERQEFRELQYADKNTNLVKSSIPDAPFKKSWHELALKRMIREASEKGYSRLSWTPGEAQAARYDLSKQVDEVRLVPKNKNTDPAYEYRIDAFKNGERVTTKPANSEKEVADIVGKEVAKKLFEENKEGKGSSLKGQQLSIGGEGMKGFYDQIIPKALEKLGKEHGVKVKQGDIATGQAKTLDEISTDLGYGGWHTGLTKAQKEHVENVWADQKPKREGSSKIHYIDIPQSLKDAAMHKGFPLFSSTHMYIPVDHDPFEKKKK